MLLPALHHQRNLLQRFKGINGTIDSGYSLINNITPCVHLMFALDFKKYYLQGLKHKYLKEKKPECLQFKIMAGSYAKKVCLIVFLFSH